MRRARVFPATLVELVDGGNVVATAPLTAGTAGTSVTLTSGTHGLSACFGGSGNSLPSTAPDVAFEVQAAVSLAITISDAPKAAIPHTRTVVVRTVLPANLADVSFTCARTAAAAASAAEQSTIR
jgi:hypothetical protein